MKKVNVEIHLICRDGSKIKKSIRLPKDKVEAGIYDYAELQIHQPDQNLRLGWLGEVKVLND